MQHLLRKEINFLSLLVIASWLSVGYLFYCLSHDVGGLLWRSLDVFALESHFHGDGQVRSLNFLHVASSGRSCGLA
jgi:hypothetical protein